MYVHVSIWTVKKECVKNRVTLGDGKTGKVYSRIMWRYIMLHGFVSCVRACRVFIIFASVQGQGLVTADPAN